MESIGHRGMLLLINEMQILSIHDIIIMDCYRFSVFQHDSLLD